LPSNTLDEADNAMSWDSLAVEAEGRRRGDASPTLYTSGEPRFSSSSTTVRVGNGTLTSDHRFLGQRDLRDRLALGRLHGAAHGQAGHGDRLADDGDLDPVVGDQPLGLDLQIHRRNDDLARLLAGGAKRLYGADGDRSVEGIHRLGVRVRLQEVLHHVEGVARGRRGELLGHDPDVREQREVVLETVDPVIGQVETGRAGQHHHLTLSAQSIGGIGRQHLTHDVGVLADEPGELVGVRGDAVVDHRDAVGDGLLDRRHRSVGACRNQYDRRDLALDDVLDLRDLATEVPVAAGVVDLDVVAELLPLVEVAEALHLEVGIAGGGQHHRDFLLGLGLRDDRRAERQERRNDDRERRRCAAAAQAFPQMFPHDVLRSC
jgi:hypothetical protein